MCEEAALAPAIERPDFNTITGFFRVTDLQTLTKSGPLLMLSRYAKIARVCSSSANASIKSVSSKSALFPRETKLEYPIPSAQLQSNIPVNKAPL